MIEILYDDKEEGSISTKLWGEIMNNDIFQQAIMSCMLLISLISGSLLNAEVNVNVKGPKTVVAGEEFQYVVLIKNPPNANNEMVLMYYMPPKELEYISSETENADIFPIKYEREFNEVYGEGFDLQGDSDISVIIKLKAKEDLTFDEQVAASYFSFFVVDEEAEAEYSQRKALVVMRAQVDREIDSSQS